MGGSRAGWRLIATIATLTAAAGLGGCGTPAPGFTFAAVPTTCEELTGEFREAAFTSSNLLEPEAAIADSGRTRQLSCGVSVDHPDVGRPVEVWVTIVQVAMEVDEFAGLPVEEWLRDQADDALTSRATIADACVPEPVDMAGLFSMMCIYDTEGVFVYALMSAVDLTTRTYALTLVELTNDGDEELAVLAAVAEELAGASIAVIFS
jgi:hypothetical protein